MGLNNLFKNILKNKYQIVVEELIGTLTPVLHDYNFKFNNIYTLSKNEYSDVTWAIENTDKYFQFHLHKLSGYYRWHEAIPESTPDYELTLLIGDGGHDFYEKKWSAVPLSLLTKNAKEVYTFNNLEELKTQLNEIRSSLKSSMTIFTNEFDDFLMIRKKSNMEKVVNQTVTVDTKTGKDKVEIDLKDQTFKEKYTK